MAEGVRGPPITPIRTTSWPGFWGGCAQMPRLVIIISPLDRLLLLLLADHSKSADVS
jgi:hypothetical protein